MSTWPEPSRILCVALAAGTALLTGASCSPGNRAPSTPSVSLSGHAILGVPVTIEVTAADPDGDSIAYTVDWGDTSTDTWSAAQPSGKGVSLQHAYGDSGRFQLRAKARDEELAESDWTDYRQVEVAPESGGPPLALSMVAGTDSTVTILWEPPISGRQCLYRVYFRGVHDSTFELWCTTVSTMSQHLPTGKTGFYKVAAVFGQTPYESPTVLSTVPVHTPTVTVSELNAGPGSSGFGWDRSSGSGRVYSMADSGNVPCVDFYISDLDTGHSEVPYVILSPDQAELVDPGASGLVPAGNWRVNGFSDPLCSEQLPLPSYTPPPSPTYFTYAELPFAGAPLYIACYTYGEVEKHYALVKVTNVDAEAGAVSLETWYQLVPDLRLIAH